MRDDDSAFMCAPPEVTYTITLCQAVSSGGLCVPAQRHVAHGWCMTGCPHLLLEYSNTGAWLPGWARACSWGDRSALMRDSTGAPREKKGPSSENIQSELLQWGRPFTDLIDLLEPALTTLFGGRFRLDHYYVRPQGCPRVVTFRLRRPSHGQLTTAHDLCICSSTC